MSDQDSFAQGDNVNFIENLYKIYKEDPSKVEKSWRNFFEGYEFSLRVKDKSVATNLSSHVANEESFKVKALIELYRKSGHKSANLDPLNIQMKSLGKDFDNFSATPLNKNSFFEDKNFGLGRCRVADLIKVLQKTYCSSIGAEFKHIANPEIVSWLQEKIEGCNNHPQVKREDRQRILKKLAQAEHFENFLQMRYLGQKRFSLEGLESLIPLLDSLILESSQLGAEEICLGMAHRGRLNVLTNIMGKSYEHMLCEFEGSEFNPFDIDGDVKYHLGFASYYKTPFEKDVRLYLSPNPSHLEAVNPVLEGFVRRRQESLGGKSKIVPVLLHGDAAFMGQGIVSETLNLSQLDNYKTGGTIHIITNNLIGFTTDPSDSRSCCYSSDIAKVIDAPIFHVNADHPEAVIWVAKLASMFRAKFSQDVVIDLIGYRRHGHNETDEPAFTQPLLYQKIAKQKTVFKKYKEQVIDGGFSSKEEIEIVEKTIKDELNKNYEKVHGKKNRLTPLEVPREFKSVFDYKKVSRSEMLKNVSTKVSLENLHTIAKKITSVPKSFTPHKKIKRLLDNRAKMMAGSGSIDWGFSELLGLGSVIREGYSIRFTGQDCRRGTFTSRHAVLCDNQNGEMFNVISQIDGGESKFINSPLSELACLGFEFGYSVASDKFLVVWEAQFGDFSNGAQIIIDQFLVASEAKWQQTSPLVLLLPHGYEGMGPEHSSARPERFLQSCGNLNIQVCNPTTPAQYFHLLRRQAFRSFQKPLVIMSPKSLLRHPKVISKIDDYTKTGFQEVLDDAKVKNPDTVEKLIFCSGKIYYDLIALRDNERRVEETAVLRIEQLYPFPAEILETVFRKYKKVKEIKWVQEEPKNMGCYNFILPRFQALMPKKVKFGYVGRKHSGSTAEGSGKSHQLEQQRIVDEAFSLVCAWEPRKK